MTESDPGRGGKDPRAQLWAVQMAWELAGGITLTPQPRFGSTGVSSHGPTALHRGSAQGGRSHAAVRRDELCHPHPDSHPWLRDCGCRWVHYGETSSSTA